MSRSVWITYAWDDSKDGDVDFTVQELVRAGLDVKLDRWNLSAGKRLWEQIEKFIRDPSESSVVSYKCLYSLCHSGLDPESMFAPGFQPALEWHQHPSYVKIYTRHYTSAWLLYATQASLGSEKCKEEFAYALERALETRGSEFPIIALFSATVDRDLIPYGIKTRLFVSITDPDWKDRIVAAVEGRPPNITKVNVEPYALEWTLETGHFRLGRFGRVRV